MFEVGVLGRGLDLFDVNIDLGSGADSPVSMVTSRVESFNGAQGVQQLGGHVNRLAGNQGNIAVLHVEITSPLSTCTKMGCTLWCSCQDWPAASSMRVRLPPSASTILRPGAYLQRGSALR